MTIPLEGGDRERQTTTVGNHGVEKVPLLIVVCKIAIYRSRLSNDIVSYSICIESDLVIPNFTPHLCKINICITLYSWLSASPNLSRNECPTLYDMDWNASPCMVHATTRYRISGFNCVVN